MIKDTFFSLSRFINLCRKDVIENWKTNLLRVVLMYGVMAVFMGFNGFRSYSRFNYNSDYDPAWIFALVTLVWGLWGFGCLSASFTMERMKTKTGRLSTLMVPATSFEKYFSRWFVSTILFLVVFLLAFKFADLTRVLICKLKYPDIAVIAPVSLSHCVGNDVPYYTLFRTLDQLVLTISAYFFFQSCFVLGSAIWPKNAFIKTFAAGACIFLIYMFVAMGMSKLLLAQNLVEYGFNRSDECVGHIVSIIAVLLAVVNWVIAYYRFKEAEIINRM